MDNRLDLSYEYPWLDMSQTEKVSGGGMKYFAFVYSAVLSLFIQDMHIYIYFTCDIFFQLKILRAYNTTLHSRTHNNSAATVAKHICSANW